MTDLAQAGLASRHRDDTLASSPTLHEAVRSRPSSTQMEHNQRRLSATSSSVHSEDLDNWPGFDSHDKFEDSGVDLAEKRDELPGETDTTDGLGHGQWQGTPNSGSDEDEELTSAALSRRAEIILANAKKRLNVCAILISCDDSAVTDSAGYGRESSGRARVPRSDTNIQHSKQRA